MISWRYYRKAKEYEAKTYLHAKKQEAGFPQLPTHGDPRSGRNI